MPTIVTTLPLLAPLSLSHALSLSRCLSLALLPSLKREAGSFVCVRAGTFPCLCARMRVYMWVNVHVCEGICERKTIE